MNPVVVIPVVFGLRKRRKTIPKNPVEVYDHPTVPGNAHELRRCLGSLSAIQDMPPVILLVSTQPSARIAARDTVDSVVADYPDLNVLVVGESEAQLVRQRLIQLGMPDLGVQAGLVGYAAMRNLGLLIANALRYDAVVFLEDDEVVEDVDFMARAMYGLGKRTRRGATVLAKTGFYFNSENSYLSMSQNHWYNRFWQQGKAFDAWISAAMAGPRLTLSNHVCGGCLALHQQAFARFPFDPWIPRGEDLDYLLNLRMHGWDIWFDNAWSVKYLPPATGNEGTRFRQDIYRWMYEHRKVTFSQSLPGLQPITPESLEPYPGPFLRPGIDWRVNTTAALRSLTRPNKADYRRAARAAAREAKAYAQEHCGKYFDLLRVWPDAVQRITGDRILAHALMQRFRFARADQPVQKAPSVSSRGAQPIEALPRPFIDPGMTADIRLDT